MAQQHNGFSFDQWPNSGKPMSQPQRFNNQRRSQQYQPINGDGLLSTPFVPTGPMYLSLPAKYDAQCNRGQSAHQLKTSNHRQQHQHSQRPMASSQSFSGKSTNSLPTNNTSNLISNKSKPNTSDDIIDEFSDRMDIWRKKRNQFRANTITETLAATSISTNESNNSNQDGEFEPHVRNANNSNEVSTIVVTVWIISQPCFRPKNE